MQEKRVYLERRARIKLDVLSDWIDYRNADGQRIDFTDLAIFSYIDKMDCSGHPKVKAHRDIMGRPWIDLGRLSNAIPLLRLKPQAISDRISKMNDAQLLDARTVKVVVPGIGARKELHAMPSLRYRTLEEEYDEAEGRAAAGRQSRARVMCSVSRYAWPSVSRYRTLLGVSTPAKRAGEKKSKSTGGEQDSGRAEDFPRRLPG
jgi:hypothetical protein